MSIAYAEMYELLKHYFPRAYTEKIPENIFEVIEKFRDKSHPFKVDPDFVLIDRSKSLSKRTIDLLAYLNLEYWATPEERERLMKIYKRNDQKHDLEMYREMAQEEED